MIAIAWAIMTHIAATTNEPDIIFICVALVCISTLIEWFK